MNNKIDKLKTDVDDIKNSLNELKNNVSLSEDEKKKQAENLKSKAETTKKEIEKEIHSLENKTDDESKKQKEEAETLLNSFNEIMSLYASILNSQESEEPEEEQQEEKKGFFKRTKEWVWEQWDDVWDGEKWKTERWKNLLRTAWFIVTWVWGVVLAYKWIKKLWNLAFWDKDEEGKDEDKEKKSKEKKEKKKEKKKKRKERREERRRKRKENRPWRQKFLIWSAVAWWTVVWWVQIYKHWNKISSWVKEKLWMALSFEEAMSFVESEVRNWINSDNNFWEFSAHFEGMSYDENTQEISSFWQKTKINKSNKTIEWKDMDGVQFASREELFHAVNIVNFAKRELKWRGANETPFSINGRTWDIDFDLSESWKTQFVGANWSNFWTWALWLWWAWGWWLLWWYLLWVKWWLTWAVAWWLAWYTLWSVIDNTSTIWRACGTIAKWANLKKFVNYLNEQNIWGEQKEEYKPDDETPIHKYLNKVKREIDDGLWSEDSGRRDLQVERNESTPNTYKIKSYYQEITLKLEWCTAKKWEEIDFSKITKIHVEKYEKINGKTIESWWDWLDIDFPLTEEWLKEGIRTANLTNMIVNRYKLAWKEKYPFYYTSSWWNGITESLKIDTGRTLGNPSWLTTILSKQTCKNKYPTLFKDLNKYSQVWSIWLGIKQKDLHDQALQDKSEWSQYIKFLHQIGKWNFWKK